MVDKNWGIKRVCLGCGAKFYDFNKSPIICPACGMEFDAEYLSKRKSRPISEKSEEDIIVDDDLIVSVETEDDDMVALDDDGEADIALDDEGR